MVLSRILAVIFVGAFLLISALAGVALSASLPPVEAAMNAKCDNLTILHIGGGALASQVVDWLAEMGADVVSSTDIPEAVELSSDILVIFGGEWFEQRIYDTGLHDLLRLASSWDAKLVVIGATTSRFFEAVDSAGILGVPVAETGEVRNPAYYNPPAVGLGMKTVDGHTGPSLFFSCTSSPDLLGQSLIEWLRSTPAALEASAVAGGPYYLRFVAEYSCLPLLDSNPYGRVSLTVPIYKLMGDGVPDYDWYLYRVELESMPGEIAYPCSPWVNDYTWAHHQIFEGGSVRWLSDYMPTTMRGTDTVDVGLGSFFPNRWSYSLKDVAVLDLSDYSRSTAYWQHDIDQRKPVARASYLSEPGFVVRTTQDSWAFVDAWYQVRFARPFGLWWRTHTMGPSPTLRLDWLQAGD